MLEPCSVLEGSGPWLGSAALGTEDRGRWYAVQCQPHRERGAAAHLANQDFRTFLPCRETPRRHARKIEIVRRPFFPGYLFVRLDLMRDSWRCVNNTFGVARLVMQGDRPVAAPRGVVEALVAACDKNGLLRWHADLARGQSVRVLTGPFADFIGKLDRLTDTGRAHVLLDIMGARMPVSLARDCLVPATSCL